MNTKRELFNLIQKSAKTLKKDTAKMYEWAKSSNIPHNTYKTMVRETIEETKLMAVEMLNVDLFTQEERKALINHYKDKTINPLLAMNCDLYWESSETPEIINVALGKVANEMRYYFDKKYEVEE